MTRWLRRVGLALLFSLVAGFAFGTCVRWRAERPTVYIGAADRPVSPQGLALLRASLALAAPGTGGGYSSSMLSLRIAPVKAS